MNNLRKIGLSALAGSLATFSVNAADFSVSGGASITFDDPNRGFSDRGNGFYMGDSLTFNASGETDNGVGVAVSYELDGTAAIDDMKIVLSGDSWGSLTFDGHGGSSALGAVDDVTPNAYEEAWDVIDTNGSTTGGTPSTIGGGGSNGMFIYKTPSMGGAVATLAYHNSGGSDAAESYMDFAVALSPEAVEGLTLGFANADNAVGNSIDQDKTTMYAKYAIGAFTVGVQQSDLDDTRANSDAEVLAYGVTYAVNDDFSIGYSYHEYETEVTTDQDQESTGVSFSYTSGGMTLGGAMNEVENMGGTAATDREGYEFTLSFAF